MNGEKNTRQIIRFSSLAVAGLLFQNNLWAAGVVSVFTDTGLRSAVAGGGLVTFASSGTIVLTNELLITSDTSIDASGQAVILSGGGVTRLFSIQPGVSLILQSLTLTNGLARGTNGPAGVDGGPGQGGAIYNNGGLLTAGACFFLGNSALGGTGGTNVSFPPFQPLGFGGAGRGGAIYNQNGGIVVSNSVFAGNQALGAQGAQTTANQVSSGGDSTGGALYSTAGQVLLLNCVVSSNQSVSGTGQRFGGSLVGSAAASGGAIELTGGKLNLNTCRFEKNVSRVPYVTSSVGGAIAERGGELSVLDSTFSENLVTGGSYLGIGSPSGTPGGDAAGGALYIAGGAAGFTNSTFTKNQVVAGASLQGNSPGAGRGGAIYSATNLTLLNCTMHANTATPGDGGPGIPSASFGGGLCAVGGNQNLTNVTIANNAAFPSVSGPNMTFGGGIYVTNATLQLLNTLLSANPGSNSYGTIIDLGHNLSSDTSCNFTGPGSLNNTDPILSPLDDFGGPTPTMALLAGSPAINAGDPVAFPPIDQRGRTRPFGAAPDIGAFESSPPYTIRGVVSGNTLKDEVLVVAGLTTISTTNHGSYHLDGLSANTWSVSPQSADYLFIPTNRLVTVGPDRIGVNFTAYHWNALSLDDVTNQVMHVIFASTNAPTFRGLVSSNLIQWSPAFTNTIGPDKYSEIFIPIGTEAARFYRAVSP